MTPEKFKSIFEGSDIAHGRCEYTGKTNARGKQETKNWTVREPVTLKHFSDHLEGVKSLGLPPIRQDSMVRWGALDIDEYGVDHTTLISHIYANDLPLVPFRTKSGGLHIYLFLTEWVPAAWMMATLGSFASGLGLSRCEIFPKQAALSAEEGSNDVGNWINLPYFGGTRKCIRADNTEMTVEEFEAFIPTRLFLQNQIEKTPMRPNDELFPEGPPCLNAIFGRKAEQGNRNIALQNLAVYLKRAEPVHWRESLHRLNREVYQDPLPRDEVEATIIKSNLRKDYRYQCSSDPLRRFCDSHACCRRKFGIPPSGGSVEALGSNRSLTKVETDPVTWYLDITRSDGTVKRLKLSTEELQNPMLFQRRAMEVLHEMPIPPKREEWTDIVSSLMTAVNVVHVPKSATIQGIFEDAVRTWLYSRSVEGDSKCLLRGVPERKGDEIQFRVSDLMEFLAQKRTLAKVTTKEANLWLRELGAEPAGFRNIEKRGVNPWKISLPKDTVQHETPNEQEPF